MKQLLYFSAPWCNPCKILAPILEEVAQQYPVKKINIDEESDLAAQYGIRSIPTTILVENGQEIERKIGVQPKTYYLQLFN
jgi:thioredoxin 1